MKFYKFKLTHFIISTSFFSRSDLDTSNNNSTGANVQLDQSTDDFDKNAGNSWLFPLHKYEKREYQFKISQTCLFNNTLVCLPTGLGKTFIASVVIYNFYRWFPKSKIIFMVSLTTSICIDYEPESHNFTSSRPTHAPSSTSKSTHATKSLEFQKLTQANSPAN